MPAPPAGEQDLRDHALRFTQAEGQVLALLNDAATGDRRRATRQALETLTALRLLDHRAPIIAAYLHENPRGHASAVRDLAGSLAKRLDNGAQTAARHARETFTAVEPDTVSDMSPIAVLAAVDSRGTRWSLGRWADMNTQTIGRQATSRGIADQVGTGRTVTINVGECSYCAGFAGEATIGEDALPPFHPACSCTASR